MISERVGLLAEDGTRLSATWDAPERAGDGGILLLPGWWRRAESTRIRELALQLARRASVLTLDFRGHGESGGRFTFGAREHLDVEAALREMSRRGVRRAALAGLSMGGCAAIVAAGRGAALPLEIAGIVSVAAPSDFGLIRPAPWRVSAGAMDRRDWKPPRMSVGAFLGDKLAPSAHAARLGVPLRVVHARRDWLIDHAHGERLHDAAGGASELLLVDLPGKHADELLAFPAIAERLLKPHLLGLLDPPATDDAPEIDPTPCLASLRELVADPSRHSRDLGGIPLRGDVSAVRAFATRDGAHLSFLVGGDPAWARGLRDGSAHGLNLLATQLLADGASWSPALREAVRSALGALSGGPPPRRFTITPRGDGGIAARVEPA